MRPYVSILASFILCFLLFHCAKRGRPTGGPKDETPPVLLRAKPELYTTQFNSDRIILEFDEYVKLIDLQKQLIISPPMGQASYSIQPQGAASKTISIFLRDSLNANTTYLFNFGNSIQDNNEGNPLPFFKYIFSTGKDLDSLNVEGSVGDALNRKADPYISVMLYRVDSTYNDSIIFNRKPDYVTNTLDSLNYFSLDYLKAGKYLLVALKDQAKNFVFDSNSDKIGFIDDLVEVPTTKQFQLKVFQEIPSFKFKTPALTAANRIEFGYVGTDLESINVNLLSPHPDDFRYQILKDREKDTLHYWFTPFETDSLLFELEQGATKDTVSVKMRTLALDSLKIVATINRELPLSERFKLQLNTPIDRVDATRVSVRDRDSISLEFQSRLDKVLNLLEIDFLPLPEQRYYIDVLPGAITDFYGVTNDSIRYTLTTKSLSDYGSIRLSLDGVKRYPIIIQIINPKEEIIREFISQADKSEYIFEYLDPGKYSIRVIYDDNSNGKWDTGNFLDKKQPEEVKYHPAVIELRANWDVLETLKLTD